MIICACVSLGLFAITYRSRRHTSVPAISAAYAVYTFESGQRAGGGIAILTYTAAFMLLHDLHLFCRQSFRCQLTAKAMLNIVLRPEDGMCAASQGFGLLPLPTAVKICWSDRAADRSNSQEALHGHADKLRPAEFKQEASQTHIREIHLVLLLTVFPSVVCRHHHLLVQQAAI